MVAFHAPKSLVNIAICEKCAGQEDAFERRI